MKRLPSIGSFEFTSEEMVIGDPNLELDQQEHQLVVRVRRGCWHAFQTLHSTDRKAEIYAFHGEYSDVGELVWGGNHEEIRFVGPLTGAFDRTHFRDSTTYPPSEKHPYPGDAWYHLLICERLRKGLAAVIPFGVCVAWDGPTAVSFGTQSATNALIEGVCFRLYSQSED